MTSISLNSGLTPQSGVPLPPLDPVVALATENIALKTNINTLVREQGLLINELRELKSSIAMLRFKSGCADLNIVQPQFAYEKATISQKQFEQLKNEIRISREEIRLQGVTIKALNAILGLFPEKPVQKSNQELQQRINKLEELLDSKTQELEQVIQELEQVREDLNLLAKRPRLETPAIRDQGKAEMPEQIKALKEEIAELRAQNEQLVQKLNRQTQNQNPPPFSASRPPSLLNHHSLPLPLPAGFSHSSSSMEDSFPSSIHTEHSMGILDSPETRYRALLQQAAQKEALHRQVEISKE